MSTDSNPPASPQTPTDPPKPKRASPSPINKKYLDEIDLIRLLVPQAQKAERSAALTANNWDPARITALGASATAMESAAFAAVGRSQAREMDTGEEAEARRQLLSAIHPIRAGAKRKYRNVPDAVAGRATYFVNKETNVSLERLLFIAGAMLFKLTPQAPATEPEDTLPGVTAAALATLTDTRAAYLGADAAQHDVESQRSQAHVSVVGAYVAAHNERIDLQLAADQAWSFHDPANIAIRRDFHIPIDRPAVE